MFVRFAGKAAWTTVQKNKCKQHSTTERACYFEYEDLLLDKGGKWQLALSLETNLNATNKSSVHSPNEPGGTNVAYKAATVSDVQGQNSTAESDIHMSEVNIAVHGEKVHVPVLVLEVHVFQMGAIGRHKIGLSIAILLGTLIAIALEIIHRTLLSITGSMLTLGLLLWCDMMPTLKVVVSWIDVSTLSLLFGMMVIVGQLSKTGIFEVLTGKLVKVSKGDKFRLTCILCILTAVLSAFLDNVTTMILLAPVTIEMSHALQIDPVAILIAQTLFSNIGGTATLIGDPPNIIVGTAFNDEISFVDFIVHLGPGVVIIFVPCLFFVKYVFGNGLTGKLEHFGAATRLSSTFKIKNMKGLKQSGVVLVVVLLMFVTHSLHHIDPAWYVRKNTFLCMLFVRLLYIHRRHFK